jgi:hypothetical protein
MDVSYIKVNENFFYLTPDNQCKVKYLPVWMICRGHSMHLKMNRIAGRI